MSQGYEYVKNSRHNLKRRLLYIMGDKCCICGYNKCPTALEFHHLDPKQKDFSISSNTNSSFENSAQEVKKCILVCANCHREIHFNLISQEEILQYKSFDEQKYQEIKQELIDLKTKKIQYCKNCGKIISKGADKCLECSIQERTKVKNKPSREELKNMIRNLSFVQIAHIYNVTDNAIRKWCDKLNLPRTKKEINSYSDNEWEKI